MNPLIQYAATEDGVSIAFWRMGEGDETLLVLPMLPLSHLQVEWQIPGFRQWWEHVAESRTIVRYDSRGTGLSERGIEDLSLDAHIFDILAVLDRCEIDRVAILASSYAGPLGLAFAARYPERVSRLVLWMTHASIEDVTGRLNSQQSEQREAVNNLANADWELFIRTYFHRAVGWSAGAVANQFTMLARNSIEPELFFPALGRYSLFDARPEIPKVRVPTLVLHRQKFQGSSVEVAKGLAARIPDARLVLLDGDSIAPFVGDSEGVLQIIDAFLDEGASEDCPAPPPARVATTSPSHESQPGPPPTIAGSLRTLLFTDVEGHTAMMQRLGDAVGRELLRHHERVTRDALQRYGGDEVKTLGDGFLASFASAQRALECAVALQRAFQQPGPGGETVRIRVGVNAGEPIAEDDDLFGASVIAAARIAAQAKGGEILTSLVVRELVAGKGFSFSDRGHAELRGFDEPVRIYELSWRQPQPA